MKKLLVIILLLSATVVGHSQAKKMLNALQSNGVYPTADTVVNTATGTLTLKSDGTANTTSVQVSITNISGTTGGTVTLQGSNDGILYAAASATTLTASSTALSMLWSFVGSPYVYYRLSYTGASTMSCSFTGSVFKH